MPMHSHPPTWLDAKSERADRAPKCRGGNDADVTPASRRNKHPPGRPGTVANAAVSDEGTRWPIDQNRQGGNARRYG